jgi:hypothetical protein
MGPADPGKFTDERFGFQLWHGRGDRSGGRRRVDSFASIRGWKEWSLECNQVASILGDRYSTETGIVSFPSETTEEIRQSKREVRLLKKELRLLVKEKKSEIAQIKASYRAKRAETFPGLLVTKTEKLQESRRERERELAPYLSEVAYVESVIHTLDEFMLQFERALLE